jgi:peroxiredoxin Q/BCP
MPLVEPGRKAPAFSLPDQDGKPHRLKDYAGRPLILYFYPKDDTPGCTKEACAFRDALPDFKKGRAAVLGVSVLDVASKARFARKHRLNFPCDSKESPLTPSTTAPAFFIFPWVSRKAQASRVQPGVSSFG